MTLNAEQINKQITTFARGLTMRQKVTIAIGVVAVAATLWLFVFLFDKAQYKPLFSGLSPGDAQTLAHRLADKNVPFQMTSDETAIMVPADQLDKARLDVAAEGMPLSGRLGFEIFDKPNWAGSDFAEKVNFQRALEGELERTIETLGEVESARVHLVIPQESLFTEQERQAKASVVIKLKGGELGDEAHEAITHLVASAVENLKPENVSLINADGGSPILTHGSEESNRPRSLQQYEDNLAGKIVATLEPVVGIGKARANVSVEYSSATSDSTQETYDPNGSVVLTSQLTTENVADVNAEGSPGTPSNVPGKEPGLAPTPAATPATPSATPPGGATPPAAGAAAAANTAPPADGGDADNPSAMHTENKTYAVSKTVRHTVQPSGNLRRITAAVLVDDAEDIKMQNGQKVGTRRKRTADEMKQIEDLVSAAIGLDPTRGDKVAVENLSFQSPPNETLGKPTLVERMAPMVNRWMNVIRYGALILLFVLVYMLVLRPIKRQIVTTFEEFPKQLEAARNQAPALAGAAPGSPAVNGVTDDTATIEASIQQLGATPLEAKQAVMIKKNLLEKVKKEPAAASRLIQNWMRQEEKA
jgi:flagellar M-ring protein FliF